MSLRGWEDRRYDLPPAFQRFWKGPIENLLGERFEAPVKPPAPDCPSACFRIRWPTPNIEGIWREIWAHIVLTDGERAVFRSLRQSEKRREEWLLARTVAKDAFRSIVRDQTGILLGPQDVEIRNDESGCPDIAGAWRDDPRLALRPLLSIAHSHGTALAWVVLADSQYHRIGIDLESLERGPDGDWGSLAFTEREKDLIRRRPSSEEREWELRLWCAKESLGKALGTGLSKGPRSIEIFEEGKDNGTLLAMSRIGKGSGSPDSSGKRTTVHTARVENWIVGWTTLDVRGEP
jgi:phosphopantetheinyl transferase